jgi:hypothetical protein
MNLIRLKQSIAQWNSISYCCSLMLSWGVYLRYSFATIFLSGITLPPDGSFSHYSISLTNLR